MGIERKGIDRTLHVMRGGGEARCVRIANPDWFAWGRSLATLIFPNPWTYSRVNRASCN